MQNPSSPIGNTPVSGSKHLFNKLPPIVWRPAIAKTQKKKINIMIVSLRRGRADRRAETRILSPSILDIVLRGLRTLKDLSALSLTLPESARKRVIVI